MISDAGVTVRSMPLRVILSTAEEVLRKKNFPIAERLFEEALRIKNYSIRGLSGLGRLYNEINEPTKASCCLTRLMTYRPGVPNASAQFAHACSMLGNFSGAARWYRRALSVAPDDRATAIALGITLLRLGEWEEGLALYDLREGVVSLEKSIGKEKIWDGTADLCGKNVLVVGEQGHGDHIQFLRYCALLKDKGARVTFFTRELLEKLCAWMPSIDEVALNDDKVSFDYAVMAMSLPRLFKTRPDNIPLRSAYLTAPPDAAVRVASKLSGKRKIALAWKGNPQNSRDAVRSCPPDLFARLIKNRPDVEFYALPFDLSSETHERLSQLRPICEPGSTFADVAEQLLSFDLVISVDTGLVHLAGALGIPTWLMIGHQPDWRWLAVGNESLWYDSVRLFRITDGWSDLIDQVGEELDHFLANPSERSQ
ncbi:MAG: hypothetical protein JJ959_16830 [Nisaea sp.]|uniref:tetratricopeptide repeat-containing glycosyltransferase family protein n=1 Tax=Nisaea sp. TaxID=2024842 RepID=UPI001B16DF76|nr:tetratricopeptide repeat protein [Nisaea sp.]MBO6562212.1 hypothetical protein [Nisaea sp.]